MRGALDISGKKRVRVRRIFLTDDVFTTGATSSECARTLKSRGRHTGRMPSRSLAQCPANLKETIGRGAGLFFITQALHWSSKTFMIAQISKSPHCLFTPVLYR